MQHGHTNLVEMLLLSGMNIETRNLQGETLLHLAARLEGHFLAFWYYYICVVIACWCIETRPPSRRDGVVPRRQT
jgi:hypothetical protein